MAWRVVSSVAVYLPTGEEQAQVHVVPDYGPAHTLTPDCWCEPKEDPEVPRVYTHDTAH